MKNNAIIITIIAIVANISCYGMYPFFKKPSMEDVRRRPWAYTERHKQALRKQDFAEREKQIQARVQRLKDEGKTDKEIDNELFEVRYKNTPEQKKVHERFDESRTADKAYRTATRTPNNSFPPSSITELERASNNKSKQFMKAIEARNQTPEYKSYPYRPENYQNKSTLSSWWSNLWSPRPQTTNKNFINSRPINTQQSSTNWFSRWWYGK